MLNLSTSICSQREMEKENKKKKHTHTLSELFKNRSGIFALQAPIIFHEFVFFPSLLI
jgi:hypothetical protein